MNSSSNRLSTSLGPSQSFSRGLSCTGEGGSELGTTFCPSQLTSQDRELKGSALHYARDNYGIQVPLYSFTHFISEIAVAIGMVQISIR